MIYFVLILHIAFSIYFILNVNAFLWFFNDVYQIVYYFISSLKLNVLKKIVLIIIVIVYYSLF